MCTNANFFPFLMYKGPIIPQWFFISILLLINKLITSANLAKCTPMVILSK